MTAIEGVSALRAARPPGAPALRARSCPPSGLVACASVLALVGMSWMVWVFSQPSASGMVRHGPHGAAMWVITSLLAVPVVLGGVWIAAQLNRFARDVIGATWNLSLTRPVVLSGHTAVGLGPGCHRLITFAGADPPEPARTTASSTSHHQPPAHPTTASRSWRAASASPGAFEPSLGALGSSEPRVRTFPAQTRRSTVLDPVAGSSAACPRPLAGRHARAAASAHAPNVQEAAASQHPGSQRRCADRLEECRCPLAPEPAGQPRFLDSPRGGRRPPPLAPLSRATPSRLRSTPHLLRRSGRVRCSSAAAWTRRR